MSADLACDACLAPLPVELLAPGLPVACPGCGAELEGQVFPALDWALPAGELGEEVQEPGEATCFYHPARRAATACTRCGAFVCRLCDLPLAGERLCPRCLDAGARKKTIPSLVTERLLHGRVALSLATLPLLIFYFTFFTAPAAIFVSLRYWNAPKSLVRPSRVPHVVAVLLGLAEIAGWVVGGILVVRYLTQGGRP